MWYHEASPLRHQSLLDSWKVKTFLSAFLFAHPVILSFQFLYLDPACSSADFAFLKAHTRSYPSVSLRELWAIIRVTGDPLPDNFCMNTAHTMAQPPSSNGNGVAADPAASARSHGRGGAGNINSSPSAKLEASDLKTPTIKSNLYTTGRGGSGNMVRTNKIDSHVTSSSSKSLSLTTIPPGQEQPSQRCRNPRSPRR